MEFLFTKEGQEIGSNSGFPVNEAVYDSEDYWAAGDDQGCLGTTGAVMQIQANMWKWILSGQTKRPQRKFRSLKNAYHTFQGE